MLWTPPKSYATRASASQVVRHSVGQLVSRSVAQQGSCQLVSTLISQSVSQSDGQSVSRSILTLALDKTYGYRKKNIYFKLATDGVRVLIFGATGVDSNRKFSQWLLLRTVYFSFMSVRLISFRFVSLQVLKQMSLIATQRSLKTNRWNSLLKKRSPKWRNSPKELSVIFPRATERYFVTSEE